MMDDQQIPISNGQSEKPIRPRLDTQPSADARLSYHDDLIEQVHDRASIPDRKPSPLRQIHNAELPVLVKPKSKQLQPHDLPYSRLDILRSPETGIADLSVDIVLVQIGASNNDLHSRMGVKDLQGLPNTARERQPSSTNTAEATPSSPTTKAERKPKRQQTAKGARPLGWLVDKSMLPRKISGCRVLRFGFSPSRIKGAQLEIDTIAVQLLEKMRNKMTSVVPIIFVAYEIGGLVLQQALTHAAYDDKFRRIVVATAGVVFLGTQFLGSDAVSDEIAKQFAIPDPQEALRDIRPTNMKLKKRQSVFIERMNRSYIPVIFFYEKKNINIKREQVCSCPLGSGPVLSSAIPS